MYSWILVFPQWGILIRCWLLSAQQVQSRWYSSLSLRISPATLLDVYPSCMNSGSRSWCTPFTRFCNMDWQYWELCCMALLSFRWDWLKKLLFYCRKSFNISVHHLPHQHHPWVKHQVTQILLLEADWPSNMRKIIHIYKPLKIYLAFLCVPKLIFSFTDTISKICFISAVHEVKSTVWKIFE